MHNLKIVSDKNDPSGSILDRVWAATQPAELSSDEFDQIWMNVKHACDHPTVLPISPSDRPRRLLAWVPFGLANAAAILVAAWIMNRPLEPVVVVPTNPVEVVLTHYEIEPFETVVVDLNGRVETERRVTSDEPALLAFNDVQAINQNDTLSHMEDLSND